MNPQVLQVFFDGGCRLCSREVAYYRQRDRGGRIEWVDIAAADFDARVHGLDPQRVQHVLHARLADGRVFVEAAAFVQIWQALPRGVLTGALRWVLKIPGMMALAGAVYRIVARHRRRLFGRCAPDTCRTSAAGDRG